MTARLAAVPPHGTVAIRGGTVVDSGGSRRADVLVGGSISEVLPVVCGSDPLGR